MSRENSSKRAEKKVAAEEDLVVIGKDIRAKINKLVTDLGINKDGKRVIEVPYRVYTSSNNGIMETRGEKKRRQQAQENVGKDSKEFMITITQGKNNQVAIYDSCKVMGSSYFETDAKIGKEQDYYIEQIIPELENRKEAKAAKALASLHRGVG